MDILISDEARRAAKYYRELAKSPLPWALVTYSKGDDTVYLECTSNHDGAAQWAESWSWDHPEAIVYVNDEGSQRTYRSGYLVEATQTWLVQIERRALQTVTIELPQGVTPESRDLNLNMVAEEGDRCEPKRSREHVTLVGAIKHDGPATVFVDEWTLGKPLPH